ncbi:uncharacterized protein LOC128158996 [Crassostrea angulata]|uniref:Uncharacterized protein n=1 Tax=Magallana gigas TaxID=29159 RepID=K1PLT0_MAGGI|nr:uncharacterized protein LOC105329120 [Crassostrea gigas]XP_052677977.1 uncharacterized protein LOC128158996 [Crassostrea angulata]|eukprot:XP_011428591.1 PREDICTED: uncharacterized protein LOC105329120 [Crassostrea gigas]
MAATTTLPKISRTPLATPVPPSIQRANSMYGAYPPRELSSSMSLVRIPPRVNPLAPPPPRKRIQDHWETVEQHWHNDQRRILMQQREHQRYHSAWAKAFYGAPAEKEQYRKHFRDVLKQQMADQDISKSVAFKEKCQESKQSIAYDNDCRQKDMDAYVKKHVYLQNFRDGNKNMMEKQWQDNRTSRYLEQRIDRERLRYNPINWSCSLK